MSEQLPENSEFEPLTRTQVLVAMGVTAVILLVVTKLWVQLGSAYILPVQISVSAIAIGLGLGGLITLTSSIVYSLWVDYRLSADLYLQLVLKPLVLPDLLWLGLLPGLSEELLFRGLMLPAFGLDAFGLAISSLCFGILHLSSPRQWSYVVWATVVGMVLGISVLMTGNLLVPIVAHIVTNWLSSALWKLGQARRDRMAS